MHLGQRLRSDAVVRPPPLPTVGHHPGFLEHPQVEREAGLGRVELILEITDAPLSAPQHLEDTESGLVRESVKELRGARGVDDGRRAHGKKYISTFVDLS